VPTDDERRQANKEVLRYAFTHMNELIEAGVEEVAKYRDKESLTWLPFGLGLEPMRGDDYGMEGMLTVPVTFKFWRWEIINIFDCLDPDVLVVEADAVSRTRLLDLDYHQRYVNWITFRDGKIHGNKEYFDSDQVQLLMQERQHQDLLASK
jgi:hypothetical protein